jgi:hypothetical protein
MCVHSQGEIYPLFRFGGDKHARIVYDRVVTAGIFAFERFFLPKDSSRLGLNSALYLLHVKAAHASF